MRLNHILFFLYLFSFILGENVYDSFKCKSTDSDDIETGNKITLCLHFPELKKRVAFSINVDEYSVISVKDAFKNIVEPIENEGSDQDKEPQPENEKEPEEEPEKEPKTTPTRILFSYENLNINDLNQFEKKIRRTAETEPEVEPEEEPDKEPEIEPEEEEREEPEKEPEEEPEKEPEEEPEKEPEEEPEKEPEIDDSGKIQVIAQIGKIRTKFPGVSQILIIII